MELTKFKEIVNILVDTRAKQAKYLERIPDDIVNGVFDNEHANLGSNALDRILRVYVPADLLLELDWFVYEWKPGYTITTVDCIEYVINTKDEFFDYLDKEYNTG